MSQRLQLAAIILIVGMVAGAWAYAGAFLWAHPECRMVQKGLRVAVIDCPAEKAP